MASKKRKKPLPEWMTGLPRKTTMLQKKDAAPAGKSAMEEEMEASMPLLEFPGSVLYSSNKDDCSLLCEDIVNNLSSVSDAVIGFDMEWPVTYQAGGQAKTALVQVCPSERHCYLFHIATMTAFPSGLKRLIQNDNIKKTGVAIEGDLWKLERDFDIRVTSVVQNSTVDLSTFAKRVLKSAENWSLDGLTKHLLHHRLDKNPVVRQGDWTQYPLSEEQMEYAAVDAYASWKLYQILNDKAAR